MIGPMVADESRSQGAGRIQATSSVHALLLLFFHKEKEKKCTITNWFVTHIAALSPPWTVMCSVL